ncbi:hypothetical protein GCM10022221_25490 [Actinocorallia aurea]
MCAAFAYSTNVFMRDSGVRETRALADVHEIDLSGTGATYRNTAPDMKPFVVMEDDRVRVSAVPVPHGPAFPAFGYWFDTAYGSVTFSGDTTYSTNLERLGARTERQRASGTGRVTPPHVSGRALATAYGGRQGHPRGGASVGFGQVAVWSVGMGWGAV